MFLTALMWFVQNIVQIYGENINFQRTTLLQKKAIHIIAYAAKLDPKFDCVGSTDLENN